MSSNNSQPAGGAGTEPNYVVLEDRVSLSRLMTYVSDQDFVDDKTSYFKDGMMLHVESPNSVGGNLQFDPALDPQVMLVGGNGAVVHTLTCSDVWSAMINSGVSFNIAKAAAKISAEEDTNTTYKLVYGMFESPMEYMAEEHPDTYYFEALDWYIRAANNGQTPGATGPFYVKAVRGIVVYSTLKGRTTSTGSGSASAGFSSPLFSIDASVSDNANTEGSVSTQVFHLLLGQASSAQLPSFPTTVTYLNGIDVRSASPLAFNKEKQDLKMSVEIEGTPHSLCRRDVWAVKAGPDQNGKTNHPSLKLVDAVYHKPGESLTASLVRTRSQCEFLLSADSDPKDTADFNGILSVNMNPNIKIDHPLAINFRVPYTFPKPTLTAVGSVTSSTDAKNEGDWNFQIADGNGIDRSIDPDATHLNVNCSNGSFNGVTNATFLSLLNNMRGSFLKVHAILPASDSVSSCQLNGNVSLTAINGTTVLAPIPASATQTQQKDQKPANQVAAAH